MGILRKGWRSPPGITLLYGADKGPIRFPRNPTQREKSLRYGYRFARSVTDTPLAQVGKWGTDAPGRRDDPPGRTWSPGPAGSEWRTRRPPRFFTEDDDVGWRARAGASERQGFGPARLAVGFDRHGGRD